MFEYLGQLLTGIDYFSLGAFPILLGLSIALSLIFSNDNYENFFQGLILINVIFGIGIFLATKNAYYFLAVAVLVVIVLVLPTGSKDALMSRMKGEK